MTITTTIDPLSTPPSRLDPANFRARSDTFFGELPDFATQVNSVGTEMNATAAAAAASETAAALSETHAAASAAASAASAAVTQWVSGTYAQGVCVWSPSSFLTYRCKVAGARTIDPASDPTNWQVQMTGQPSWITITADPAPATVGSAYLCDTTSAAFSVTLPGSPADLDFIDFADCTGTFATNNLTVACNGNNIMGLAEDMTVSINNVSFRLTYIAATQDWRIL